MSSRKIGDSRSSAKHEAVDEEQAVRAHKVAYEDGAGSSLNASEMGSAAAMKVSLQLCRFMPLTKACNHFQGPQELHGWRRHLQFV